MIIIIAQNITSIRLRPVMTYILGSQCKDGVVLVADKKFTVDGGSSYEYGDKLFGDLTGIIVGFFRLYGRVRII